MFDYICTKNDVNEFRQNIDFLAIKSLNLNKIID